MWTFESESPITEEKVSVPFKEVWKIYDEGHRRHYDKGDIPSTPASGGAIKNKVDHQLIINWKVVELNMSHPD
jgi:hypothetical protein